MWDAKTLKRPTQTPLKNWLELLRTARRPRGSSRQRRAARELLKRIPAPDPASPERPCENVNLQVLRRTWVTEFSEAERAPNVRAQLAGHSVDVHENEYRQAQPAVLKRAMRKLDKRRTVVAGGRL
jgi:integrase